ncbi:MAG: recombinase family protein, partial [Haloarculaceae archaeon]
MSTDEQELDRQVTATREYALNILEADAGDLELYQDKSTGTDTARDGYKRLVSDSESGKVDTLVVKSVSRLARSIRDLDRS